MTTNLDITNLEKALDELVDALKYYHSNLAQQDPNLKRHLRAGTIQAFEFTYELAVKFIRRYLEITEPSTETIHAMAFPALIRTANEKGLLLNEIDTWKQYRDKRNISSHTYDEHQAGKVIAIVPEFISDTQFLLNQLRIRRGKI